MTNLTTKQKKAKEITMPNKKTYQCYLVIRDLDVLFEKFNYQGEATIDDLIKLLEMFKEREET